MAKPKITTYTVTGSGAIINTGEAVAANYIELNGSTGNTFVLQADTLKSAITLKGNNTIYIEGNLADYQFSQKVKTVTMIDGDHTYSFTLSTMTKASVVTTTLVFLDGQITMSNQNTPKSNVVSLRGLDDEGAVLTQKLTKTPADVSINADSTITTAATFFSNETKAADAAEAAAILDVQNTAYANAVVEIYKGAHIEANHARDQAIEADNNYQTAAAGVIDNQTASVAEALAEISLAAAERFEFAAAQQKAAAVELTAAAAVTTSTIDNAVAELANQLADAAVTESGAYQNAATADEVAAEQVILNVAEQTAYEEDFALDAVVMDYAYDATVAAEEDALAAEADYDVAEAAVTDISSAQVAVAFAHISDEAADRNVAAATAEQWAAQELTASAALTGNVVDIKAAAIATYVANENAAAAAAIKVDTLQQIVDADQILVDVTIQEGFEADFAVDVELNKYAFAAAEKAQDEAKTAEANYDVGEAAVTDISSAQIAVALAHIANEAADNFVAVAAQEQAAAVLLTASAALTGNAEYIKGAAVATYAANLNVEAAAVIKAEALQQIADADQLLLDVTQQTAYEENFALAGNIMKGAYAETVRAQEGALAADADYDVAEACAIDIHSADVAVALAHIADEAADRYLTAALQEQVVAQALTDAAEATGIDVFIEAAAIATHVADQAVEAATANKVDALEDVEDATQLLADVTAGDALAVAYDIALGVARHTHDHAEIAQADAIAADEAYDVAEAGVTDISSAQVAEALAEISNERADAAVAEALAETVAAQALTDAAAATGNAASIAVAVLFTADALANTQAAAANKVEAIQNVTDSAQILINVTTLTTAELVEYFAMRTAAHALTAYDNAEVETNAVLAVAEQLNLNYEYSQPAVNDYVLAAQAKVLADAALGLANGWVVHAAEETAAAAALKVATDATLDPTDDAAADAAVADASADTAEAAANLVVATANEVQAVADVAIYPVPPTISYVLTVNPDTFVGTAGVDFFDGTVVDTLSAFDNLDGGVGINYLQANLSGTTFASGMTIQNIQSASIQTIGAGFIGDVSTWTGLTSFNFIDSIAGSVSITEALTTTVTTIAAIAGGVNVDGGSGALAIIETGTGSADDINVGQPVVANALTSVSVTGGNDALIRDRSGLAASTGSSLTTVSLNGNTGLVNTITANGLTTLNLSNQITAGQVTTVVAAAGARALTVNLNGVVGATGGSGNTISVTDNTATTVTINAITAASYFVTATASSATTININSTAGLSLDALAGTGAATAVNISGTSFVEILGTSALAANAVITSTSSGGVSNLTVLAGQQFAGAASSGNDVITVAAGSTVANNVGTGLNTVTLLGAMAGGSLTAGSGVSDSVWVDGAGFSLSGVSGFETLYVKTGGTGTWDLGGASGFTQLVDLATAGTTFNNVGAGVDLLVYAGVTGSVAYNLANSAGATDVLDLTIYSLAGGANSITANSIETVNINIVNTGAAVQTETLTLSAPSAETINVDAEALINVVLIDTDAAIRTLDASGVTGGSFTWTAGALAAAATITGSAAGTNVVVLSAATVADTYIGGTGADTVTIANALANTITLGNGTNVVDGAATGNNTVTGGTGADTFITGTTGNNIVNFGDGANAFTATTGNNTYTGGTGVDIVSVGLASGVALGLQGVNTITLGAGNDVVTLEGVALNGNSYSYINGAAIGDTITFAHVSTTAALTASTFTNTAAIVLAPTAAFADYLNAAASTQAVTATAANFAWFQYGGNTYIVDDTTNTGAFVNGADTIVQLTGLVTVNGFTGAVDGGGTFVLV